MGAAFKQPLDIWNRACDHCGVTRIDTPTEDTKQRRLASDIYDKVRQSELRRNPWIFGIKRAILRPVDVGTVLIFPAAYSGVTTYAIGAIVLESATGEFWQTMAQTVGVAPTEDVYWQRYSGPDCALPYDYTGGTTYFAGEMVLVPATYAGGTSYNIGEVVRYATDGIYYISLTGTNVGNTPSTDTTHWMAYQTWLATSTLAVVPPVFPTGYTIWISISSNNVQNPLTTSGQWTQMTGATYRNLIPFYPLGTGPAADTRTANVYRKPRGWLRRVTENPKAGMQQWLGGPSADWLRDDLYEGNYIVTNSVANVPRMVRYMADWSDVVTMEAMFCEGVAARMGLEMNWPLNQSDAREGMIAKEYDKAIREARAINGIEAGPELSSEDPWITCRA